MAYIGSIGPGLLQAETPQTDSSADGDDEETSEPNKRPLLFAQSAASYPIIKIFAPPPRPGKVNGTFVLSDDLASSDGVLTSGEKLSTLDQMERHSREQGLIDPPSEQSVRISAPESQESQLDLLMRQREDDRKSWWRLFFYEFVALLVAVVAVYRWAFTKATKAAANAAERSFDSPTPILTPLTEEEKKIVTPVVRFDALPDVNDVTDLNTPPKKKATRRRVRGRKKRRNSVGPELDRDEGDGAESNNDEANDASSPTPSDDRQSSNGNGNGKADEKQVLQLPRSTSTVSLNDEHERLAISDTVIGFGSHGTVVLKGTWGGRPVAVKRLLSDFVRLASQEVKLLQASDDHPNVIRCKFVYPALAFLTFLQTTARSAATTSSTLH
jgi:serine/threonine-protein kinase/endoribonuclease IRE1